MVIFLSLAVAGGVWWRYTRELDFSTPPTEARLQAIRVKTESSFPRADEFDDAMAIPAAVPKPADVPAPEPKLELGDLTRPPALDEYSAVAEQGAPRLIELASALEKKGAYRRALLAWERVLDSANPSDQEAAAALESIVRLRPTLPDWNEDPAAVIRISLDAGTGKSLAKTLAPVLEEAAAEIGVASSGIVSVTAKVTAGKTSSARKGATPVALWLTGPEQGSASTEVLSFTAESPDRLREQILKTVYQLVRSQLVRTARRSAPAEPAGTEQPADSLTHRVTRLDWSEFATTLQPVLAKPVRH